MRKLRKFLLGVLALTVIGTSSYAVHNPYQDFGIDLSYHDIVTYEPTEGEHVIAYGVDIEKAEQFYLFIRDFLGAAYVGEKVKIYRAHPKFANGAIGNKSRIGEYVGIYRKSLVYGEDIIVYNGDDTTLLHELSHFFYNHMRGYHKDEAFAQLTERYIVMENTYRNLIKIMSIISELKNEKNQMLN